MKPINSSTIRNKALLTASLAAALACTPLLSATSMGAPASSTDPQFANNPNHSSQKSLFHRPISEDRDNANLAKAISAFKRNPTPENHSSVKVAFAKLDLDIAELDSRRLRSSGSERTALNAKMGDLQQYRADQAQRLPRGTELATEPSTAEKMKDKMTSGAHRIGRSVRSGAKTTVAKTKEGAEIVAEKVETGASKTKRTLEKGAEKTKDAIKGDNH